MVNKKMNKINLILKSLIVIFIIILIYIFNNNYSSAATVSSDIDGIDESRYPGYKNKIKQLQTIYPNIKVMYTGLDWNTVIQNEKVHGRNLVPTTYSDEWICSDCGKKLYDTGWYCASDDAVKFLMDPRVYIDTKNIFQFQRLDTSAGTLNASKIQLAAHNSFLEDWENVVAIYNAAHDNNINSIHLVTRTIQEQGWNGTSVLSSGERYVGIDNNTYEGLYNLFSIGATGSNKPEVHTNGLARAASEGWTSRPLSIAGGGTFIRDKYLNRKQYTLYLQKFDVDSSYDGLYWHQYMQNLFGAKNEAALMYDAYNKAGWLLNKDFEFVIPIYENMPKEISQEPNAEYYGEINTDLKTMSIGQENNGRNYITGDILIAEWINGVARVPKDLPEITIKSTDGTFSTGVALTHKEGLNYTYYRIIDNLDINKEYYLEAKLTTNKNISTKKQQKVKMPNMTIGQYKGTTMKTKNNKIYLSTGEYIGEINTDLKNIRIEENTIRGNLLIAEWINNIAYTPKGMPTLLLKSTDNEYIKEVELEYESGLNYNYRIEIEEIDLSKQYYLEAKLTGEDNVGTRKVQTVRINNQTIGEYGNRIYVVNNNIIKPTYNGEINTDLKEMKIGVNGGGREYIYGKILIAEWINGEAKEPIGMPKMTLKSTDGEYSAGMYVRHEGGLNYYYDRVISNIDTSKEYYIEAELTGENNISNKKVQRVKIGDKTIGQVGTIKVVTENNKIKIADSSLYYGEVNTDLKEMKIGLNGGGRKYLYGNIIIAEWINGEATKPKEMPKMTLKSTDGEYSAGMYVRNEGGLNYYYDRVIYNIDTSKEYYIEVELTESKNISKKKKQNANINVRGTIGELNNRNAQIEDNKIIFKGNEYNGDINTDLKEMKIGVNGGGREYLYGRIIIAEWIEGEATEPKELPKMTLKSTDGEYSAGMYVRNEGGLNYYYDRVIYNIDTSKEYYIEVELTEEDNISEKKKQNANINVRGTIGKFKNRNAQIENNKIVFRGNEYNGEINTDLKEMKIGLNGGGREYLYGRIIIAEWINGEATEPKELPRMTLKSTDGEYSAGMYVRHEGGLNYYYDRVIFNIDTSKEYYIEVELTEENNISAKKKQNANINVREEIGRFKETLKIEIVNNKIVFKPISRVSIQNETNKLIMQRSVIEEQEEKEKEKTEKILEEENEEIKKSEEQEDIKEEKEQEEQEDIKEEKEQEKITK